VDIVSRRVVRCTLTLNSQGNALLCSCSLLYISCSSNLTIGKIFSSFLLVIADVSILMLVFLFFFPLGVFRFFEYRFVFSAVTDCISGSPQSQNIQYSDAMIPWNEI
jgi:hypothetical protein